MLCLSSAKSGNSGSTPHDGHHASDAAADSAGASLNAARSEMSRVRKRSKSFRTKFPKGTAQAAPAESGDALVGEIQKLISARKESEDSITQAEANLARYEVFGNLDPGIRRRPGKSGVYVRLTNPNTANLSPSTETACFFLFGSTPAATATRW